MYYQNYEDYMRSVLGYPNNNLEPTYSFENDYYDVDTEDEDLYPEIYKIIYPMICKVCDEKANNKRITKELVDEMTEIIYANVETEMEIEVPQNREVLKNGDVRNPNVKQPEIQTRQRVPNRTLRDLIRILILRELFRRRRPGRPPIRPPRPPFTGPGMGPRPPMPRDYTNLYY